MRKKLYLPSPCSIPWEQMAGNDRVRLCAGCQRNVYNLLEMTNEEITELVRNHTGNLCARSYRRPDGKMFTQSSSRRRTAVTRHATTIAAATLASVMGFVIPRTVFAAINGSPPALLQTQAATKAGKGTVFHVQVFFTMDPIGNAQITIVNRGIGQKLTASSNDRGEIRMLDIPRGMYDVTVDAPGFQRFTVPLHLPSKNVIKIELELPVLGTTV